MRINKYYLLILTVFIFVFGTSRIFSQSENVKWSKADYSYAIPAKNNERDFAVNEKGIGNILLKSAADAYWFFISDVDGDNCSFSPTCSSFLLLSVRRTNLIQGTLMFFDRFTRDMDIYKINHYPRVKDGHYYDPPSLYTLNSENIKYLSPSEVVDK